MFVSTLAGFTAPERGCGEGLTVATWDSAGVIVAFARVDDPAAEDAPQLIIAFQRAWVHSQQRGPCGLRYGNR